MSLKNKCCQKKDIGPEIFLVKAKFWSEIFFQLKFVIKQIVSGIFLGPILSEFFFYWIFFLIWSNKFVSETKFVRKEMDWILKEDFGQKTFLVRNILQSEKKIGLDLAAI